MIYTVTFNPAIDYVVRLNSPLQVAAINRATGEDCVLGGKGIRPAPGWSAAWPPRACTPISSTCKRG